MSENKIMRRKTRPVMVGNIAIGGNNPIRIQSMTNTHTHDVNATTEQIIRLYETGCEIVRVTVQGQREVRACEAIRNNLLKRNYNIPLVADIHFSPDIAFDVADFVDKIRINPGNYADPRATFKEITEHSPHDLEKIEERLVPLIEKCQRLKRSIRIGVNHGSLSDRIMSQYGNTPLGMVHSAMEFAQIFRKHDFHEFLFSIKASNPIIMVESYRQLISKMDENKWNYPLHLGVTEAGEGEDGRIRSAMGTGALLLDGIGDTIRVSLTEDPCNEIKPCRQIISIASDYQPKKEALYKYRQHPSELLKLKYNIPFEDMLIRSSMECGALFFNGIGEDVSIEAPYDQKLLENLRLSILQAARKKISKTEFISCPGCGRTLFDLQGMTKLVKKRLAGLPGLKIAIMGCIVNGPGEMADADYGFIGAGHNKVNLYAGQECIARGLDINSAINQLLKIIKQKE